MHSNETRLILSTYYRELQKFQTLLTQRYQEIHTVCSMEEMPYIKQKFNTMLKHVEAQFQNLERLYL